MLRAWTEKLKKEGEHFSIRRRVSMVIHDHRQLNVDALTG